MEKRSFVDVGKLGPLFGNWVPYKVWGKRHNLKDTSFKRPFSVHIKGKVNVLSLEEILEIFRSPANR